AHALFRHTMQHHWPLQTASAGNRVEQGWNVVPINWAVIEIAKVLEDRPRPDRGQKAVHGRARMIENIADKAADARRVGLDLGDDFLNSVAGAADRAHRPDLREILRQSPN